MEEGKRESLAVIDHTEDKKRLARVFPILGGAAIILIGATGGICLSGVVNLAGRTTELSNYGERLEFTAKYLTMGVLWLVFMIFYVIFQRGRTGAVNPMAGGDYAFQKQANILQNSFEQFIMSAFAQICLVAFLDEKWTMRTIPWVNFLFIIGRITFLIGYPMKRTFGIFCSVFPTTGMIFVALYKFIEHLFF